MMKDAFSDFEYTDGFEFISGRGMAFNSLSKREEDCCYCCGAIMAADGENCQNDRFGRSFCCEVCRKNYYGGKDK